MKLFTILLNLAKNIQSALYKIGLIADYVVERGSDGIWNYEKWESGKAVLLGVTNLSINYDFRNSSTGYLWYAGSGADVALPSGFLTSVEDAKANGFNIQNTGWAVFCSCYATISNVHLCILGWSTGGVLTQAFQIKVIGTWK